MAEATTSTVQEQTSDPQDPTGFKAWATARTKGETPTTEEEETQSAAAGQGEGSNTGTAAQAKTAPDSEPGDHQETETGEPEETPEETAAEHKLRTSSRQRRIDRLTKENEELTRRLEAATKPTVTERSGTEKPAAPPDPNRPKPVLKDFKTLEEYNESLTDWKLDQREAARQAQAQQQARADALKQEQDGWEKKQSAVAKVHADYFETIEAVKAPTGPGTLAMRQALMEEEHGAEILYHLAKHPDELARITACPPAKAAVEIGKLAASLETPNPGTNGKPKISGAPPPPSRLSRSSGIQTDSIDDPAVQRDWKRWAKAREAQLKGR